MIGRWGPVIKKKKEKVEKEKRKKLQIFILASNLTAIRVHLFVMFCIAESIAAGLSPTLRLDTNPSAAAAAAERDPAVLGRNYIWIHS